MSDTPSVLLAGFALAASHLAAGRLRLLDVIPRSRWLSLAGGISVAYVFAHLMPEIAERSDEISETIDDVGWLLVLAGLAIFYSIEHLALAARDDDGRPPAEGSPPRVFWISLGSFAVYNLAIGYLLHEQAGAGAGALFQYTFALGVHFVVNDIALRTHHKLPYDIAGRWMLAAAVIAGSAGGAVVELPASVAAAAVAVLAGGIVLNVMKEELPGERHASLLPFLAGLVGYAALATSSG